MGKTRWQLPYKESGAHDQRGPNQSPRPPGYLYAPDHEYGPQTTAEAFSERFRSISEGGYKPKERAGGLSATRNLIECAGTCRSL